MATATQPKPGRKPQVRETQCLIDGKWQPAKSGKTFETINPATEEVIAQVAEGDAADVDLAVKAAREAFDNGPWRKMDARDRGRLMNKLADLIEEELDELAALETLDNGKPIRDSRGRRPAAGDRLPALLRRLGRQDPRPDDSGPRQLFHLHAARAGGRGRADHPLELPDADGRLEVGPGPGRRLHDRDEAGRADAAHLPADGASWRKKAGIPDGVINVVPGYGPTAGGAIVKHPGVDKVAFTGEHRSGQIIMRDAAGTLKRHHASSWAARARTSSSPTPISTPRPPARISACTSTRASAAAPAAGCSSRRRSTTSSSSKLVAMNKSRKLGDPFDPATEQGPQVDKAQFDKIMGYIDVGQEGRRQVRHRRRALRRQGLLHRADAVRRRERRHGDRQGGNLRPGDVGAASSRTSTKSSSAANNTDLRPGRRRLDPRHRPRPIAWRRRSGPARCGSTATTCSTPPPRSAASRKRHRPRTRRTRFGCLHGMENRDGEFDIELVGCLWFAVHCCQPLAA